MASTGTRCSDSIVRATIFESLALADGKKKSDASLYQNTWGKTSVMFEDHQMFLNMFGYSLTVWRVTSGSARSQGDLLFGTVESNSINIAVANDWDPSSESISLADPTSWIKDPAMLNYIPCGELDCDFVARTELKMREHMSAHVADRIHCAQDVIGKNVFIREEMISEGILPPGFRVKQFITWDIESLLLKSEIGFTHSPFSIAATRNYGPSRKWFFARKDSSPKALREMVVAFIDWLEMAALEFIGELPDIDERLKNLYIQLKRHREKEQTLCPKALGKIKLYIQELKSIQCLSVLSFNGENYDIPCMKGVLFDELYNRDSEFSVIKRGSGLMQIKSGNLLFKDVGTGYKYRKFDIKNL